MRARSSYVEIVEHGSGHDPRRVGMKDVFPIAGQNHKVELLIDLPSHRLAQPRQVDVHGAHAAECVAAPERRRIRRHEDPARAGIEIWRTPHAVAELLGLCVPGVFRIAIPVVHAAIDVHPLEQVALSEHVRRKELVCRPPRSRLKRQARAVHQRHLSDVIFQKDVDGIVRHIDVGGHESRRRIGDTGRLAQIAIQPRRVARGQPRHRPFHLALRLLELSDRSQAQHQQANQERRPCNPHHHLPAKSHFQLSDPNGSGAQISISNNRRFVCNPPGAE